MSKKATYKDDFEAIYLRYDYLRRIDNFKNEWITNNQNIINITAGAMFDKLRPNFDLVGFDLDDIISVTSSYTLAFMGLYSFESNSTLKKRYVDKFTNINERPPSDIEIARVDRNNLITFLKQKLHHCSTICERKSRNIKVGREKNGIFAKTAHSRNAPDFLIITDYNDFGYRKVTQKEFKERQAFCKNNHLSTITDISGYEIFKIQILSSGMTDEDYLFLLENHYVNIYNGDPEEIAISYEDDKMLELFKKQYANIGDNLKLKKLKEFIRKNSSNPHFKQEVKTAKKLIKNIKISDQQEYL